MKNFSILVFVIIIIATLCGCVKDTQSTPDTTIDTPTTTNTTTEEIFDISLFPEVETLSENLDVYRQEVSKRLNSLGEDDNFITDEEWKAISNGEWRNTNLYQHKNFFTSFNDLYEETTKYYYPVVFKEGNSLVMWYTSETGSVLLKEVYGSWNSSNYVGHLHTDSEEQVMTSVNYSITYNQESGKVNVWRFGKIDKSYELPVGSVYCGFSTFEGYIFRSGTDVYSLKGEGTHNGDGSVVCIAHNVEYVIDADYYYGSDPWCQPLFLMTDGSIKCYIGWEDNNRTAAPDDTCHLVDLQYEGSWDK